MKSLDKKVVRTLWRMKGQALAIALVIVGGVATFVMYLSVMESLKLTQQTFYVDNRFPDVFASLKRAPEDIRHSIEAIPGVERVETRVVAGVKVKVAGYDKPVTGKLVSVPDIGEPVFDKIYLRSGRRLRPWALDEVIISDGFAKAQHLSAGDRVVVILNGREQRFTVVGIGVTPEYIYQLAPGSLIPDFERFAIMWIGRRAIENAYDMGGAFNDVTLKISNGVNELSVISRLDMLLAPFGGAGAYGRSEQLSHLYLSEEFKQLQKMSYIAPVIFLSVAAFLLNVVISRVISTEREQAATLKAFGYSNTDITLHYTKLVLVIVAIGTAGGVALGAWFGMKVSEIYMDFYHFPFIDYVLGPWVVAASFLVSFSAAVLGTVFSIWRTTRMSPAEAMRPEPPARYRVTLIERMGLGRYLSEPTRIIARNIGRRPVHSALTVLGIALAGGILMMGQMFGDSMNFIIATQFGLADREDMSVTFVEPSAGRTLYELKSIGGVRLVEPFRSVPVRLRHGYRNYLTAISGIGSGTELYRLIDSSLRVMRVPGEGLLLTDHLADVLGVRAGDELTVEALEGARPVRRVTVAGTVHQFIGMGAYMDIHALNRLMREGDVVSGAYMSIDAPKQKDIFQALFEMPRVLGIDVTSLAVENFKKTMSRQMLVFAFYLTLFATSIAFGVLYNSARIMLAERSRELASLRVLGFTRAEIAYILLGELSVLTLLAIPAGFALGYALCAYLIMNLATDIYRIPLVVSSSTYAFSATVVLASMALSAIISKRKLDRLDLVAVLKSKE